MRFWLNHPRSGKPDTMLTLATYATLSAIVKFLLNGVTFKIGATIINCGIVDAMLIGALLTPTLGAYVMRKAKDSPDDVPNAKEP